MYYRLEYSRPSLNSIDTRNFFQRFAKRLPRSCRKFFLAKLHIVLCMFYVLGLTMNNNFIESSRLFFKFNNERFVERDLNFSLESFISEKCCFKIIGPWTYIFNLKVAISKRYSS